MFGYPVFPALFVKETIFSPSSVLGFLVKCIMWGVISELVFCSDIHIYFYARNIVF